MIEITGKESESLVKLAKRLSELFPIGVEEANRLLKNILGVVEATEKMAEKMADKLRECLEVFKEVENKKEPYMMPRMIMKPIRIKELLIDKRVRCCIRNCC